jgi:endonuclease/exonuclease/phosphatase family metal-dependent hydrolase
MIAATIRDYIKTAHRPQPKKKCIVMGDFNAIIDVYLDKKGG